MRSAPPAPRELNCMRMPESMERIGGRMEKRSTNGIVLELCRQDDQNRPIVYTDEASP